MEEITLFSLWLLLVQRHELQVAGLDCDRRADPFQRLDGIPLRPQRLAGGSSEWVAISCQRGQRHDLPAISSVLLSLKQASGQIVFVPPCLDQNNRAAGHQPGVGGGSIPVPDPVPDGLGVGLSTALVHGSWLDIIERPSDPVSFLEQYLGRIDRWQSGQEVRCPQSTRRSTA